MGAQRVYRRTTPYPATSLGGLDYTQNADILYTAHISYPPQKLVRYGHTDWRWATLVFGPTIVPPVGMSATPSTPNTTDIHTQTYSYVITALSTGSPVQESQASAVFTSVNDLSLAGNVNTLTLPALPVGVERHIIFRKLAGAYGYIGNTAETSFVDENLIPILSETPPEGYNPFFSAGNYPSSIGLHQQRLTFAGTMNVINGIWMSRSADFENMDRSRPLRADDSLLFSLVSDRVNSIGYIVSMKDLMVLTGDGIWSIGGGDGGAITPGAILPERQTGRGAARVKPVVVDNIMFYATNKGSEIRALGFTFEIEGYKSDNISIFSPHLFSYAVKRLAFQEEPYAALWTLMTDGTLLCLTWEQEQSVWGWSPMEIDGFVEDIAVITEAGYDRLYLIVTRVFGETTYRFVERMALPHTTLTTACHLDCAISQSFVTPTTAVTGLWHLEGQLVSATYAVEDDPNGYAAHDLLVANGTVTLPVEAISATVGLRYSGRLETLPAALNSQAGSLHTSRQQITDVVVRTLDTKGISVGASGTELEQVEPEFGDDLNADPDFSTVDYEVTVPGDWKDTSTVVVEQTEPFPAHVVGIFAGMRVSQ